VGKRYLYYIVPQSKGYCNYTVMSILLSESSSKSSAKLNVQLYFDSCRLIKSDILTSYKCCKIKMHICHSKVTKLEDTEYDKLHANMW